jgi:hypothetical protein
MKDSSHSQGTLVEAVQGQSLWTARGILVFVMTVFASEIRTIFYNF